MEKDTKIITRYWGEINPLEVGDYLKVGGYEALKKFIHEMKPGDIIQEIKKSGLCGRGGAGFATGNKMEMAAAHQGEKYFICNLDESEPGTYKDRLIAENNPHQLIEGIIISSLAIGAEKAIIYMNGRYEKPREILERALEQAGKEGLLGKEILNSSYDLEIEIFSGAGAYVCGEETALINSIEGNRGEPRLRPPYPTDEGLFGRPTLINNAETIANIPWIIMNGAEKYASLGLNGHSGTKLYILGGAVKNIGACEGPMGMTIREVIEKLGGGIRAGKEFWFAQIGGASGRLAAEKDLEIPLSYDRNSPVPLGSGSILVVDNSVDMRDLILSWTTFFRSESCGKCVPCREGTFRLWEIAKRLQDGDISDQDEKAVRDILWALENTTFCPLGKFAAAAFSDVIEKGV